MGPSFLHFTLFTFSLFFFSISSLLLSSVIIYQICSAISKCQKRFQMRCRNGCTAISLPCQQFQWESRKYNRLIEIEKERESERSSSFHLRYASFVHFLRPLKFILLVFVRSFVRRSECLVRFLERNGVYLCVVSILKTGYKQACLIYSLHCE